MRKKLYINDVDTSTYGIYLNSDTYLNSPSQDITEYSVPARDGSLITNNKRLNNVIRKFDCFINSDVLDNLDLLKKLIYTSNGYMKIASDYDTDTYQLGFLAQEIQVDPFTSGTNLQIKFSLYFSCMPQKFYNTNNTAYKKLTNFNASDVRYVLPRSWNDSENGIDIAKMISDIPIDFQPTDEYYGCMYIATGLNDETVTNISATISDNLFVAVVCEKYYASQTPDEYYQLVCYGYGSASADSFVIPQSSPGSYSLLVVFATKPNVDVSGSADTHNGTESVSFDSSNYQVSVSNANAIGLDIEYDARFHLIKTGEKVNSPVFVEGKLNGISQGESVYIVHFEEMDDDFIDEIVDRFAYLDIDVNQNVVNVLIGSDNTATIYKSGDSMDITSYLEVSGSIEGKSDEIVATLYLGYTNRGSIRRWELKPRWWKL